MDNEYSKEILKQSVARACAALGIKQARYECVEILADVIRNFIQTTAAAAHENAELSGRACVGIQDVMPALEQVSPQHCRWTDLKVFAFDEQDDDDDEDEEEAKDGDDDDDEEGKESENKPKAGKWNQPFPFEIPYFPIEPPVTKNLATTFGGELVGIKRDSFIPSHLPPYPLSHTYKRYGASKKRGMPGGEARPDKKQRQNSVKNARQSLAKIESAADS